MCHADVFDKRNFDFAGIWLIDYFFLAPFVSCDNVQYSNLMELEQM